MILIFFGLALLELPLTWGDLKTDRNSEQVILVSVLYRHGNRTVINPYPNDPYKDRSFWPDGWGQLIKEGMLGHYELGKWLRRQYGALLPEEYNYDDILVKSSDVDRTLMSAYSNLAGLYEPDSHRNWDADIRWRPIPVHTLPEQEDKLLAGKKPCPRYNKLLKELKSSDWVKQIEQKNKFLFQTVSDATGKNITDLSSLEYLHDTLFVESLFNYKLPDWTHNIFPEPMRALAQITFSFQCYNSELARLKMGPLLDEIITNMKKKIDGNLVPDRKMFMYSAHDTTVANFLTGLGVFNSMCPPYFSAAIIELSKKDTDYFVTLKYRNSSTEDPYILTLPGCDPLCPFQQFKQLTERLIPEDWDTECQLSLVEEVFELVQLRMLAVASLSIFLILLFISTYFICRSTRTKQDFVYESLSVSEAT